MDLKSYIWRRGKQGSETAASYAKPWTLRFKWKDDKGNARSKSYQFATKNDAADARPKLEAQLTKTHGRSTVGDRMTFAEFAEYAKKTFYRPAEIVGGRKVGGVKSHRQARIQIDVLTEYFGNKRLGQITRNDIEGLKSWRYKQGDRRGHSGKLKPKERDAVSASTVNRLLATFTRMMKFAYAEGWVSRDITLGSKAIDRDAERAKTRILTADEEFRLLSACGGGRTISYTRNGKRITATTDGENPFLKAIILLGLESGLRRNEILTLEWKDIDLEKGIVEVQSQHTKTQRERTVPLLKRTVAELRALPTFGRDGKIFPFNDFKRSWSTALRLAEIEGLTFHDLRRTFVTRLNVRQVPLAIAGKLAGHSTLATTQKHYVSIDDSAIIEDVRAKLEGNGETETENLN